jgi:pyridinium-3,5-bisthiocarboxylic acid mononucleotide nickel chelatase
VKIAYLDLIAGASGDMLLGALVDAGLPFEELRQALAGLRLPGFELSCAKVMRGAFAATKVDVQVTDEETARHLPEIEAVIAASALPPAIQARALHIFRRMIAAEAAIHDAPVESVHLHELGALDTIVDVTGVLLGLDLLGVERVVVSPVPLGRGVMVGSHGRMPLPAPATLALLAPQPEAGLTGAPVVGVDHALETVTPTAAALLTELATGYGSIPAMRLMAVGYGAGTRLAPEPNILRVLLGEAASPEEAEEEALDLLETSIDDMNPEVYGYVLERLLAEGALDAHLAPVIMKKNRPGVVLNVLCRPDDSARLRALLFAETTTLGIRTQRVARHCLPRASEWVETPYGAVRVKVARWDGDSLKAAPEYEDCRAAAQAHGIPLREVYRAALAAWQAASGK